MRIQELECQLRRRLAYPYRWGGVQNDRRDNATNFVYSIPSFDDLLAEIRSRFGQNPDHDAWFNYALNRWYNFWSARAVEEIFGALDRVIPARDKRDRLADFTIGNIRFDHKTTVFPKGFGRDLSYAQDHPQELIAWLYAHQSQEGRKHLRNRLFIVLYARDGRHWKLKAEIAWLKSLIEAYVANFALANLYRFSLERDSTTLADIIWAIK